MKFLDCKKPIVDLRKIRKETLARIFGTKIVPLFYEDYDMKTFSKMGPVNNRMSISKGFDSEYVEFFYTAE